MTLFIFHPNHFAASGIAPLPCREHFVHCYAGRGIAFIEQYQSGLVNAFVLIDTIKTSGVTSEMQIDLQTFLQRNAVFADIRNSGEVFVNHMLPGIIYPLLAKVITIALMLF